MTPWNPAAGDLFPGSPTWSAIGALAAWLLALLLGASLLPLRGDEDDGPGARILPWLVVGISVESSIWLALSWLGALRPALIVPVAGLLGLVGAGLGGRRIVAAFRARPTDPRGTTDDGLRWLSVASWLALGLTLAATLRLALWPTLFYDDLVYHLALPRQALLTGSWPALPGLHYSFMPAGWDAVYLLPLALGGGSGPQWMNVVGLGLFAWATYRLALRGAGRAAALAATALLVVAPLTISLGAFAGNDLFVGLAICVAVERLIAGAGERPVLVGLLAGAAWGAKYTALPAAAGLGFAAALAGSGGAARRASRTAIVGAVTLLLPSLWTLRSLVLTGNPLYPAFRSLFDGRYWDSVSATLVAEQVSHGGLVNRGVAAFALALVDLVRRSGDLGFPGGLNPLFVPLALLGLVGLRRIRGGGVLLVVLVVSYIGWSATSLNVRYALGMLAALAPFAAFAVQRAAAFAARESWRRLAGPALGLLLLLATSGPLVDGVVRHMRYYGQETRFVGGTPRRDLLTSRLNIAAAGREIASRLPADARILLVAEGRLAPMPRPTVGSSAYDRPGRRRRAEHRRAERAARRLHPRRRQLPRARAIRRTVPLCRSLRPRGLAALPRLARGGPGAGRPARQRRDLSDSPRRDRGQEVTMRREATEVAVVGGGLVGSLLAIFLVERGRRVTVYERRPDWRLGGRSAGRSINLVLTRRGLRALRQVGLEEEARQLTVPVTGRTMHSVSGELTFQPYGRDESECNHSISRSGLNEFLVRKAEEHGVRFRFCARLVDVDAERRRLAFVDEERAEPFEVDSEYTFGTDGAGSAVREALERNGSLESSTEMLDHGYKELLIPAAEDGGFRIERHALHIWPRGASMLMALPNQDGSFTATLYLPHRGPDGFEELDGVERVLDLFRRRFPDAIPLIPDLTRSFFDNPTGTLGTVRCSPWHDRDRILLLGDAGHAIVPFFGQGMNCGFEDCTVLGELLDRAEGDDREQLFAEFFRSRKPNADAIADMALENFVEMRDLVADPAFLLRKSVEHRLEQEIPREYRSRYSMVMYSQIPFARAREAGRIQQEILDELCRALSSADRLDLQRARELIRRRLTPYLERNRISLNY